MSVLMKYGTIISHIDGVISLDRNNIIRTFNHRAEELFGFTENEIKGRDIKLILDPFYHKLFEGSIFDFRSPDHVCKIGIDTIIKAKRKDGSEFNFNLSFVEVKIKNYEETFLIVRENNKLLDALAAKKESETRLNALLESAVDGIISMSISGIIEKVNPAAAKLFGYEKEELIGQNVNILMPNPHKSAHDGYLNNYKKTGVKKIIGSGRELEGLTKNGELLPIWLSVTETKVNGESYFTGIIHDISEQRKSEEKLRKLNEELADKVKERTIEIERALDYLEVNNRNLSREIIKREKAEEEAKNALAVEMELGELKSRFVSMASHEFRTPLSGILSSISLIARYNTTELDEKRKVHIGRIKTSVQNLTTILDDFLSLDKLQVGKIECHPIEFDLIEMTKTVVEMMSQVLKPKQIIKHDHVGSENIVFMDPNLLTNIFNNLLSNASKYSGEGKEITLITEISEDKLVITFKDQGIGISDEDKSRMFERFFRAKNASNIQGTGLGLAIVRHYVTLMQGEVSFVSTLGEGSTFIVVLPQKISLNKTNNENT